MYLLIKFPSLWFVNLRNSIIVTDYRQSQFYLCFYLPANVMVSTLTWVQLMDTQQEIGWPASSRVLSFWLNSSLSRHTTSIHLFQAHLVAKKFNFFYPLLFFGVFFKNLWLSCLALILDLWTEKILLLILEQILPPGQQGKKKRNFPLQETGKWRHEAWYPCRAFHYEFMTFVYPFLYNLTARRNSKFCVPGISLSHLPTEVERVPKNTHLCRYKLFCRDLSFSQGVKSLARGDPIITVRLIDSILVIENAMRNTYLFLL